MAVEFVGKVWTTEVWDGDPVHYNVNRPEIVDVKMRFQPGTESNDWALAFGTKEQERVWNLVFHSITQPTVFYPFWKTLILYPPIYKSQEALWCLLFQAVRHLNVEVVEYLLTLNCAPALHWNTALNHSNIQNSEIGGLGDQIGFLLCRDPLVRLTKGKRGIIKERWMARVKKEYLEIWMGLDHFTPLSKEILNLVYF
jgi:hypothetical protein